MIKFNTLLTYKYYLYKNYLLLNQIQVTKQLSLLKTLVSD
jgi:hypothetical protein